MFKQTLAIRPKLGYIAIITKEYFDKNRGFLPYHRPRDKFIKTKFFECSGTFDVTLVLNPHYGCRNQYAKTKVLKTEHGLLICDLSAVFAYHNCWQRYMRDHLFETEEGKLLIFRDGKDSKAQVLRIKMKEATSATDPQQV